MRGLILKTFSGQGFFVDCKALQARSATPAQPTGLPAYGNRLLPLDSTHYQALRKEGRRLIGFSANYHLLIQRWHGMARPESYSGLPHSA